MVELNTVDKSYSRLIKRIQGFGCNVINVINAFASRSLEQKKNLLESISLNNDNKLKKNNMWRLMANR